MDIQDVLKYLQFITSECQRHIRTKSVTDDQLNQLMIELTNFQKKVNESSNLTEEIKTEIQSLKLNYSSSQAKRNTALLLLTIVTIGTWIYALNLRMQAKRVEALEYLIEDVSTVEMRIKMSL